MIYLTRKRIKHIVVIAICSIILFIFGGFHHLLEKDFYSEFRWPHEGDIQPLVLQLKRNESPQVPPINFYSFQYYKSSEIKCQSIKDLRLVYLVKSSPENFERRLAIRSSWGFQRRFSDVEIRTVFLIGLRNDDELQKAINEEYRQYQDTVQANYTDAYFNNTYKTMSGFTWAVKYCPHSKFYMFVDDDFYVSTKNVLRYLRFPTNYPGYLKDPTSNLKFLKNTKRNVLFDTLNDIELGEDVRLYTGYVFRSSPHRHFTSKWYVSLEEYPYHLWPPYVAAGALILSREALLDMYYASFYTKHFRFDDIYLGLLAYKTEVEPYHSEQFYFYKESFTRDDFKYMVASHGFDDPKRLFQVWSEQKNLGNA